MATATAGDMPHNINMLRWGVRFVTKEGRLNPESALRKSAGWRPECRSSLATNPAQRMPNEIEGMTLPSRHPRRLYSAPALQGQEGAYTQPQADADIDRQGHGIEDQVLAALEEAAQASQPAPSYRALAARIGRTTDRPIRSALAKLESQGRIRRIATPVGNRYEIPALGLITAPHRTAAPKQARSAQPDRPLTGWNLIRDNSLTEPQRQALSAARLEIAQHGAASIVDVARRLSIADAAARDRLLRVAGRGHLAQRADGRFILAEPAAPASDGVRVEIREGVRVTICPPRHADGALVFRQALSGGRRGL